MDDMQAFDRQLANVVLRRVGPSEPVDDAAIFTAVTAAQSPAWRVRPLFSATRFAVAGVIVALFSGLLLAGVLTTQQDGEVRPAAATASPSPMTTEELLAGMGTEEVEPGVRRVANDGVRDLAFTVADPGPFVDIAPDGGVWLSGGGSSLGLGNPVESQFPGSWWWHDVEVGPDGSLWTIGEISEDRWGIFSFDGEEWTLSASPTPDGLPLGSLAVGPDGTVWAIDRTDMALLRLEDDGTLATVEGWADVYSGLVSWDELAASPDGDVWLVGMVRGDGPDAEVLLRFDGDGWEVIPGPPGGFLNLPLGNSLDIGSDGTLWVNASNGYLYEDGVGGLARLDDPGWTTFSEGDGVQNWGGQGWIATDLLRVAPDGSLWMNGTPGSGSVCGGVAHYDGKTWSSYLRSSCAYDIAIARDGSAFVTADLSGVARGDSSQAGLYVITPEVSRNTE